MNVWRRYTVLFLFTLVMVFGSLPLRATCEGDGLSKPHVGFQYIGPDHLGHGHIFITYSFPNTASHLDRVLDVRVDGTPQYSEHPLQSEDELDFDLKLTCLATGPHTIEVHAEACGNATSPDYNHSESRVYTVNTTPTVSLDFIPDATGEGEVTVTYDFSNTDSYLDRLLDFHADGVPWNVERPLNVSDPPWTFHLGKSCPSVLEVWATACNRFNDSSYLAYAVHPAEKHLPVITSVSILQIDVTANGDPTFAATVDYDLKSTSGTLSIGIENWVGADKVEHPAVTLETIEVPNNPSKGTKVFTFNGWKGQQLPVLVTATTACGTTKKPSAVDCPDCPAGASANPVYFTDGNMRLSDGDPLPPIAGRTLSRTYNSHEQVVALFGRGWTTLFDRRLIVHPAAISITTETNEIVRFELNAGTWRQSWPTARHELARLTHDAAAGTYEYRALGATEIAVFDAATGRLLSVRDPAALREGTIGYDAQGRPTIFTDAVTQVSWNLLYDGDTRRVISVSVAGRPDLAWSYSYDAAGNLLAVLAPGSAPWRSYEYAANRMTASRDALGNLIESHAYDANGFAISSTGDVDEIANIEYLPGTLAHERITRVTYRTGAQAEYRLLAVGNGWRPVQVTGGCASCGAHDRTFVHDDHGRVIREQNADGYVTVMTYADDQMVSEERWLKPSGCDPKSDAQHCRLTTESLAAAVLETTGASVGIAYRHADPLWPDKVTAMSQPSVLSVGHTVLAQRTYHPVTGAIVTSTITGWTGATPAIVSRTTQTTFYDGSETAVFDPGGTFPSAWLSLPQPANVTKSIDGARLDVQDVVAFVHYPVDDAVPALLRGRLAATKSAVDLITHYEDYDVFGNVLRIVDPNGVATEMTYDTLGRPVSTTTKAVAGCNTSADPLCATDLIATQTYSASSGPLLQQERPGGGVIAYTYDPRGRVHTISRGQAANDLRERIETTYDALTGKKSLERTLAYDGSAWVEKTREVFAYDAQSRLQTVLHADGASVHYTYDAEDRVATTRDENHAAPNTAYAYDPAGRLASVTQTLAGAPDGVIATHYAYDIAGNLTTVTDPNGNVTSYVYDDFGQMLAQQSPVTGTTTYAYDGAGNLMRTTDANAATTERTYDAANRILTAASSRDEETETVTWTYDSASGGVYGLGRLTQMDDPSGTTSYAYERRGLLRQETHTILGTTYLQSYGYDANGNRTSIGYPSARLVTYSFDYAGRPLTATGTLAAQTTSYVTAAAYLPFGPLTSLVLGNGTTETRTYDSRYFALTSTLTAGATTLAQHTYTTDPVGNITAIADGTSPGYNRTFAYDDLNRLTAANTGSSLWGTGSYTYDRMGNLLSATLGAAIRAFTHQGTTPKINTATGLASAMTYDGAGNELKSPAGDPEGGGPAATYSPRNLLQTQFVRQYDRCLEEHGSPCILPEPVQEWLSNVYDGRGIRVASTDLLIREFIDINAPEPQPNLYFYTPELAMLNIVARSTGRKADVIWFGSHPVADHDATTVRYTFTDHLGTPILQTSAAATIVWHAEYEPYGNTYVLRAGSAPDDQPLRFPGQQVTYSTADGEESYNVFRWYRSGWGRYTQADPIDLDGGVNLFLYTHANPLALTDPLGLDTAGCDQFLGKFENPCEKECCAAHDKCYDDGNCSSGSWGDKPKCGCDQTPQCKKCNSDVVKCFSLCSVKAGIGSSKKPNYYCAKLHKYINIPKDFSSYDAAVKACEYDQAKDCKIPLSPAPPKKKPWYKKIL